jgi:hypothetical protein
MKTKQHSVMCDVKRCSVPVDIVYLTICAEGHINEYYVCTDHAIVMWMHRSSCDFLHEIVEHMASQVNGDEPTDTRFYYGEWVTVVNEKVVGHGNDPAVLYTDAVKRQLEGANVFHVGEEGLLWISKQS